MMFVWLIACTANQPPSSNGPMIELSKENGQTFFMDVYEFPNVKGQVPVAELDFAKAKDLCQSVGKRMCTMEEWKLGCGHTRFTYGNTFKQSRCYTNQHNVQGHTSLMHGRTEQIESGKKSQCVSEHGFYDMNGNVEEWVLDDWNDLSGNLAGGAWYTNWRYADCSVRYSREPDYRLATDRPIDSAGVRCCWSNWSLNENDISKDAKNYRSAKVEDASYESTNELEVSPNVWMDKFEYPNVAGATPLTSVTWYEADKLCKQNNKTLCPVSIWEATCQGQKQTAYPYGDAYRARFCNDEGTGVQASGSNSDCISESGVYDLTGNVWEWTLDDLTLPEFQNNPDIPIKEIRGGSFVSDRRKAQCTPQIGYPLTAANNAIDSLGFRCCRIESTQNRTLTKTEYAHSCPSNMVEISTGCIDVFEYPNEGGTRPTHSVTLNEARSKCKTMGKHLCDFKEWNDACAGPKQRRWSYGNQFSKDQCNHASDLKRGGSVSSGLYADCKTPEGVYDMTGNLWEWTDGGTLHGGNWNFSEGLGQCRSSATPEAHIRNDEIGFRCCATIKESTALLTSTPPTGFSQ